MRSVYRKEKKPPKYFDRKNAIAGFRGFNSAFARGIAPQDLRAHQLLSWYAFTNGNMVQMAWLTGKHRNTFVNNFKENFPRVNAVRIRKMWHAIVRQRSQVSFSGKLRILYEKLKVKPTLTPREHEALSGFWLTGAPLQVGQCYFILWASRNEWPLERIQDALDLGYRDISRYRRRALQKGSLVNRWIGLVPFRQEEWFRPRGKRKAS